MENRVLNLLCLQKKPKDWDRFIQQWNQEIGDINTETAEFEGKHYRIIEDADYDKISELSKFLSKKIWSYKTYIGWEVIKRSEWNWIKNSLDYIFIYRKTSIDFFKNRRLFCWFWTIILTEYEDNWLCQNDMIYLEEWVYNIIKEMPRGKEFLDSEFCIGNNYHAKIIAVDELIKEDRHYGVYGIFQDNKCVYVGMTMRNFESRWKEHRSIFEGKVSKPVGMVLYDKVQGDVEFKVLFDAGTACTDEELGVRDIEAIELGFITALQPVGNLRGITMKYEFSR